MHMILKYDETSLWLTGSFPTKDAACEHGAAWQKVNDDPRWQYISLPMQDNHGYYTISVQRP